MTETEPVLCTLCKLSQGTCQLHSVSNLTRLPVAKVLEQFPMYSECGLIGSPALGLLPGRDGQGATEIVDDKTFLFRRQREEAQRLHQEEEKEKKEKQQNEKAAERLRQKEIKAAEKREKLELTLEARRIQRQQEESDALRATVSSTTSSDVDQVHADHSDDQDTSAKTSVTKITHLPVKKEKLPVQPTKVDLPDVPAMPARSEDPTQIRLPGKDGSSWTPQHRQIGRSLPTRPLKSKMPRMRTADLNGTESHKLGSGGNVGARAHRNQKMEMPLVDSDMQVTAEQEVSQAWKEHEELVAIVDRVLATNYDRKTDQRDFFIVEYLVEYSNLFESLEEIGLNNDTLFTIIDRLIVVRVQYPAQTDIFTNEQISTFLLELDALYTEFGLTSTLGIQLQDELEGLIEAMVRTGLI